jgi:hypothetical protein
VTKRLYEGPALPRDQAVILEQGWNSSVLAIDGSEVEGSAGSSWELYPGTHEVDVSVTGLASKQIGIAGANSVTEKVSSSCTLSLDAVPGAHYRVTPVRKRARVPDMGEMVIELSAAVINLGSPEIEPDASCLAWCFGTIVVNARLQREECRPLFGETPK